MFVPPNTPFTLALLNETSSVAAMCMRNDCWTNAIKTFAAGSIVIYRTSVGDED